jgi:hypothetical protein
MAFLFLWHRAIFLAENDKNSRSAKVFAERGVPNYKRDFRKEVSLL